MTAAAVFITGCNSVDDGRIPAFAVTINLSSAGLWNTYGVSGFGLHREFIKELGQPGNFHYQNNTYTGYGGVLLIGGMDPYTSQTNMPLAYDLACPVECKPDVRVYVDDATFEAICPVCGSHYDVCMSGGAPTAGPALTGNPKYRLQPYRCIQTNEGGYMITR